METPLGQPVPWERVGRTAAYLASGMAGLAIAIHFLFNPYAWPDSAISGLSGVFLLTGFVAAAAAIQQRYRVEYICLPFQAGGVLLYAWWLWVIAVPDGGVITINTLFCVTLFLTVVTRLCALHPLVKSRKEQAWIGPN